jgi:predicted MPP superfamily phosphohydrolase
MLTHSEESSLEEDVLTRTWFHKALVLFDKPAKWSVWRLFVVIVSTAILAALVWALLGIDTAIAVTAGCLYVIFVALDGLVFWTLPRRRLSFGSWKAQTIVLALPRLAATILLSFAAAVFGDIWGIIGLVLIHSAGTISLIWGAVIEPHRIQLTSFSIVTNRALAAGEPIRLLHISDLHLERMTKREVKVLELVEAANADLILLTGDYLNLSYVRDEAARDDVLSLLSQLSAPYGVYAVLGSPPVDQRDVVPRLFDDLAIELLVNENRTISLDEERQMILIGIDCSHDLALDAHHLRELAADLPDHVPSILMYHAPDLLPEAAELEIDLYLCGHTHGGQVRLPWLGALLTSSHYGRKYQMGHYHEGRSDMYVSRGVGLEGLSAPRVRFLCPPEMTIVTVEGNSSA